MKKNVLPCALTAVLLLSGCSASYTPSSADKVSEVDSATEMINDKTEEPSAIENDSETIYEMGNSASLKDWTITVTDTKIVDSIAMDYGSFSPKEEGNKYLQVFVTVNNNGKQANNFLPTITVGNMVKAKVLYADGYEFTSSNLLGYSNDLHDSVINPLSSRTGEIAFEIPSSVAESDEELLIQFSSGCDAIKFKIR